MMSVGDTVEGVGKAVLASEHQCFVERMMDNQEHIPHVARIARAVARLFRDAHRSPTDADAMQKTLPAYGKQFFMYEWKNQLGPNEDEARVLDEGAAEFGRILSGA